jgi:hypothetical protein
LNLVVDFNLDLSSEERVASKSTSVKKALPMDTISMLYVLIETIVMDVVEYVFIVVLTSLSLEDNC